MDDIFEKIKYVIAKLEKENDRDIVVENQRVGSLSDKIDLSLAKRISKNSEEAMTRARLEATKKQEAIEDDSGEHDDAVCELYVDDILEKILDELGS